MYCIYREFGYFRRKEGIIVVEESHTETLAVISDKEFFQMSDEEIEEFLRPYKEKYEYRDDENGKYSEVWIQSCDDC